MWDRMNSKYKLYIKTEFIAIFTGGSENQQIQSMINIDQQTAFQMQT